MTQCHRCGHATDWTGTCWYCDAPLCEECWKQHCECGHPGARHIVDAMSWMGVHEKMRVAYAFGWVPRPPFEVWEVN